MWKNNLLCSKPLNPSTQWLDMSYTNCVRGISALAIAFFHVIIHYNVSDVFNVTGSVAVAAFLFLSGFVINESWKKHGLQHYWRKKFARVIVPYWLFFTILCLIKGDATWKSWLMDITFIKCSFWFVAYLVKCYLAYWIIRKWLNRHFYLAFIVFALISLNFFEQLEAEQSFSFVAGVWTSHHISTLRGKPESYFFKIALVGFILGISLMLFKQIPCVHAYKGTLPYHYILLFIKLPLSFTLLVMPLIWNRLTTNRLIYWSGIASLELYLVHLPLVQHMNSDPGSLLLFVVLTVALTVLMYQVDTKIIKPLFLHH